MSKTLRLILGDQLNINHSWFNKVDPQVVYVMMEMGQELTYVKHHIQKILAFFLSMRAFHKTLSVKGHRTLYLALDDGDNTQTLTENLVNILEKGRYTKFEYLLPDEYRLDRQLIDFCKSIDIDSAAVDTEHFLTSRNEVKEFFKGKKTYLMESFYRHMRRKWHFLMEGDEPAGGRWNFDADNRQRFDGKIEVPDVVIFDHDATEIKAMIDAAQIPYFGEVDAAHITWPIGHDEAGQALERFIRCSLRYFGTYEDAMDAQHPVLFHSRLSFALNTKQISPESVTREVVKAWHENQHAISIAQVEGFVRQLIGWREFMRGVYWAEMPAFETLNYFNHVRALPEWYWTGDTKMNCLKHVIGASLENAYAHHIQRLMAAGNFALLALTDPAEVDRWYLGIYIDAIQWVEITNTRGMSQFADNGIIGTKPYVASANYINKMSNYCKTCHYSHSKRTGEKACPFNSLYWNFYLIHEDKLKKNPRIGMVYQTLAKMSKEERNEISAQAAEYLKNVNQL